MQCFLSLSPPLSLYHVMSLLVDDALLVWKICAFESSFYDNVSRWCDLLTAAETQPMEYFSDLEVRSLVTRFKPPEVCNDH